VWLPATASRLAWAKPRIAPVARGRGNVRLEDSLTKASVMPSPEKSAKIPRLLGFSRLDKREPK
jgi:hypothetical protein